MKGCQLTPFRQKITLFSLLNNEEELDSFLFLHILILLIKFLALQLVTNFIIMEKFMVNYNGGFNQLICEFVRTSVSGLSITYICVKTSIDRVGHTF